MNNCKRWILMLAVALAGGCATTTQSLQPRVDEVSRKVYAKNRAPSEQREDYYVAWNGANITLVKFEYRQVKLPNEIFAKSYVPTGRRYNVFDLPNDEFLKGGRVSAWRVTLWRDKDIVAEKKSALW